MKKEIEIKWLRKELKSLFRSMDYISDKWVFPSLKLTQYVVIDCYWANPCLTTDQALPKGIV
ncbi:MAG: hypothetical protein LWX02_10740 [Deltaproteobacteria bacterium]|jgi:hypothetical protein|nr:hypothetical protein [Deltaproteobacteria bacterium]MDL1986899.1 hypothetical protein [Deltaproteobacteria bacterium]